MRTRPGFTLIELIIGMTLLVIGVVAVFLLSLFAIQLNKTNIMKVQAVELAREGLEMVRNMRDSNWKNNYPFHGGEDLWGANIVEGQSHFFIASPTFDTTSPWKIQTIDPSLARTDLTRLSLLSKSDSTVLVHKSLVDAPDSPLSPFGRYIEVDPVDADLVATSDPKADEMKMTVYVYWQQDGQDKQVELTDVLTDWKKL